YWMVVAFWDVLVPNLAGKLWPAGIQAWAIPGLLPEQEPLWYINVIPLILGIMLLWRLAPKGGWIAVWPLAFIIGAFAGLRLVAFFEADFMKQIQASILPVVVARNWSRWDYQASIDSIENFLLLAGTLACLVYF